MLNVLIIHSLFITEYYSLVRMYHSFNCSPTEGYLGCFQLMAVTIKLL